MTAPSTPTEKVNYGKAVENGRIRYLSVSQVVSFDPSQEGGCPRRWYFVKVEGRPEPTTDALRTGGDAAKILEHYLRTGEDTLPPYLRAGKHLLPRVGSDLEIEAPLGDSTKALALRDAYLRTGDPALIDPLRRAAGLFADAIPFVGAADFRHSRGEYVDEGGRIVAEPPGSRVVEVGDHKTTSRIADHVSKTGKIYPGYSKSAEQVANHPQMVGYGFHAVNRDPSTTHVRLSHIYYQTKNGFAASKRTSLIPAEEIVRRWNRVEAVTREMVDVAKLSESRQAPANAKACYSYGRPCPHSAYCEKPARKFSDLLENDEDPTMTTTLFDKLTTPPAPPTRAEEIAAERAKLAAEDDDLGFCAKCGTHLTRENGSMLPTGQVKHIGCPKSAPVHAPAPVAAPAPTAVPAAPPPPPSPITMEEDKRRDAFFNAVDEAHAKHKIAPYDEPGANDDYDAAPLPPPVIQTIEDPELRERAEAHAARRAESDKPAAAPASSSASAGAKKRCPGGNVTVPCTTDMIATKKTDCGYCKGTVKIKPEKTASGEWVAKIAGHLIMTPAPVEAAPVEAAPPVPLAPIEAAPPAPPPPAPALVVAPAPPPPPVFIAATGPLCVTEDAAFQPSSPPQSADKAIEPVTFGDLSEWSTTRTLESRAVAALEKIADALAKLAARG